MGARLPVFPLDTVLFPGLVLPLHIFEQRYLALIRHLTALPAGTPREFGVVAIRSGGLLPTATGPAGTASTTTDPGGPNPGGGRRAGSGPGNAPTGEASGSGAETAPDRTGSEHGFESEHGPGSRSAGKAVPTPVTLHEIGCTAELRQVTELPDGRFDVVTVGRRRFRINDVAEGTTPYLTADVEWLPEPTGQEQAADLLAPRVLAVFRQYLTLIRDDPDEIAEQLPDNPTVLSHLVAATAALTLGDRQRLLATPDTAGRLRAELRLLSREAALLRQVRAVPVPLAELAVPLSPN